MTGVEDSGRAAAAAEREKILAAFPDAEIVSPAEMPTILHECSCTMCGREPESTVCSGCGHAVDRTDYRGNILRDLAALARCDVLWLAPGYESSLGCVIEMAAFRGLFARGVEFRLHSQAAGSGRGTILGARFAALADLWSGLSAQRTPEPVEHDDVTIELRDAGLLRGPHDDD